MAASIQWLRCHGHHHHQYYHHLSNVFITLTIIIISVLFNSVQASKYNSCASASYDCSLNNIHVECSDDMSTPCLLMTLSSPADTLISTSSIDSTFVGLDEAHAYTMIALSTSALNEYKSIFPSATAFSCMKFNTFFKEQSTAGHAVAAIVNDVYSLSLSISTEWHVGIWPCSGSIIDIDAFNGRRIMFNVSTIDVKFSLTENASSSEGDPICNKTIIPETRNDTLCNRQQVCKKNGLCLHKPLFPSFNILDAITTLLCAIGCMFSIVAGVGGGGLFVPLMMLISGFSVEEAVPLSKAMIFAAALVGNIFEFRERIRDRPTIDVNVVLLLQPMTLGGTIIGVFLNVFLPSYIIIVLLVIILALSAYKTTTKGLAVRKKENNKPYSPSIGSAQLTVNCASNRRKSFLESSDFESNLMVLEKLSDEETQCFIIDNSETMESCTDDADTPGTPNTVDASDSIMDYEKSEGNDRTPFESIADFSTEDAYEALLVADTKLPLYRIGLLIIMFLFLFVCALLKGFVGKKCSSSYWIFAFLPLPSACIATYFIGRKLLNEHRIRLSHNHKYDESDFIFTKSHVFLFPICAFIAGIAAGCIGVGGAMVIGPVLLHMALEADPSITTATSAFIVLFTSLSTSVQYILLGKLHYGYAGWLMMFCAVSALISKRYLRMWIDRKGKKSYILFVLAGIIAVSCILTLVQGVLTIIKDSKEGKLGKIQIDELCKVEK